MLRVSAFQGSPPCSTPSPTPYADCGPVSAARAAARGAAREPPRPSRARPRAPCAQAGPDAVTGACVTARLRASTAGRDRRSLNTHGSPRNDSPSIRMLLAAEQMVFSAGRRARRPRRSAARRPPPSASAHPLALDTFARLCKRVALLGVRASARAQVRDAWKRRPVCAAACVRCGAGRGGAGRCATLISTKYLARCSAGRDIRRHAQRAPRCMKRAKRLK
jgi:hypothetical protein